MAACDEGRLMALLDGELDARERIEIEHHLAACPPCRARLQELRSARREVEESLNAYMGFLEKMEFPTHEAWQRWQSQQVKKGAMNMFTRVKRSVSAAAACLLVAGALTLQPVQTAAANFLQIFRVSQMTTVPISQRNLEAMVQELRQKGGQVKLRELGRISIDGAQGDAMTKEAQSWAEAVSVLGRTLAEPAVPPSLGLKQSNLSYGREFTVKFTLNVDKMNELLRALGSKKFLPPELNGREFSIRFPSIVEASYVPGEPTSRYLHLSIMGAPEIRVPAGVDVDELRSLLLELPILPPDLKERLASVRDWQHTLILPNIDGQGHEVKIGNTIGLLYQSGNDKNHSVALVWQQGDLWFILSGAGLTEEQALSIAQSLE